MPEVTNAEEQLTRRGLPTDPNLRVLALGTFVNRMGGGALATTFALYFTREVGLSAAQVGLAMSVAAVCSLLAQVPLGHLGDTRGPREMSALMTVLMGVFTLPLLVVRDFWLVVLFLSLTSVAMSGGGAVRNAYIARVATGGRGVAFKAYLRAVTNVAMSFGAGLGGLALLADARWAYLAVLALDASTSIAAGLIALRLPHLAPAPPRAEGEPRLAVLRDRPYVAATVLSGLFAMHFIVMEVGIPLWIATHTRAPTWMVAALLVLNTVVVALLQVRTSRGIVTVGDSAAAMRRGGMLIAAAFVIVALSDGPGPLVASVVLLLAASIHVVGEMVGSAGQWGISMGLAPMERQGQYQGFAGLGFQLAQVLAPTLITVLCIEWGRPGWVVMAAIVLGCGWAMVPVSRWAMATRERYGALSATG